MGSIGPAASKLAAAAYPLIKDVDWTSDLFLKPIPGADPQKVMKAVDKMIVMGSAMDGAALKEAAQAHVKAIDGVDAKGVLSQADFEAINAGLGKAIASVPTSKVMDVYNAMAGVVGSSPVPIRVHACSWTFSPFGRAVYLDVQPIFSVRVQCRRCYSVQLPRHRCLTPPKDSWTAMRLPCKAPNEYLCDQGTHMNCISGGYAISVQSCLQSYAGLK